MRTKHSIELVREGRFLAEVPVELMEDETEWSPYLLPADVEKLDAVRLALRTGDIEGASRQAKVYELIPRWRLTDCAVDAFCNMDVIAKLLYSI